MLSGALLKSAPSDLRPPIAAVRFVVSVCYHGCLRPHQLSEVQNVGSESSVQVREVRSCHVQLVREVQASHGVFCLLLATNTGEQRVVDGLSWRHARALTEVLCPP